MFMVLIFCCCFLQRNVTIVMGGATYTTTAPPPEISERGLDHEQVGSGGEGVDGKVEAVAITT